MQTFKAGTKVRYRNSSGRVFPAVVTAVTSQTKVNLRIGNGATKGAVTGANKVSPHASTTGFFQGGR